MLYAKFYAKLYSMQNPQKLFFEIRADYMKSESDDEYKAEQFAEFTLLFDQCDLDNDNLLNYKEFDSLRNK